MAKSFIESLFTKPTGPRGFIEVNRVVFGGAIELSIAVRAIISFEQIINKPTEITLTQITESGANVIIPVLQSYKEILRMIKAAEGN